jgi:hypothetical protein
LDLALDLSLASGIRELSTELGYARGKWKWEGYLWDTAYYFSDTITQAHLSLLKLKSRITLSCPLTYILHSFVMASLVWTIVFVFLLLELALTFILVVPVPRKIRNFIAREIFQFNIGGRLAKPILFIGIALAFALVESYFAHQRILTRMGEEQEAGISNAQHERHFHGHDKERKYKAERNMYLAGFSLTLLFVIGRITKLMQESVELEEETDRVKKFTEEAAKAEVKHATEKKDD